MSEPDFSKPAPDFESGIKRLTRIVRRERVNAIVEGQQAKKELQRMSIIDKLALINERNADYENKLTEKADFMLERFDSIDKKTDRIFHRHHTALDDRDKGLDDIEAALDRLSNSGNLPSSNGSSNGA